MNFKKNAVPPIKEPLFPGYENGHTPSNPKRSISLLTLFVVIICAFVVAFLLFKNFDRIGNRFTLSNESTTGFQIWQTVSLSGVLQNDGDFIIYTHTLTIPETSVIGLKSRSLDLTLYTGIVDIQGTVEREYNEMFIIEVNSISGALVVTWTTWTALWSGSGIYIAQAGIYLPAEFGQSYTLLNNGENWELRVQNIATNQVVSISYFTCKKTDPNKNCSQLKQNIWWSAEKTFSTSYGTTLYKLEWVTSWFFANGDNCGYFINDVSEQEVVAVANAFILPTETYVEDHLLSNMQTLCTDGTTSLMQVSKSSLGMDLNGLVLNLEWPTTDGSATCKIFVDPSQAAGGAKISYISNTPTAASTTTTTSTVSNLDTSVKQFPINLEKAMTFTSSRGYVIVFPSSNITYESLNVDESLDLPDVRCSAQMDVTKFSDKASLHDDPKVRIFTCSIKGTLNNLGNSIIQKESTNGTKFLIQIMDAAWVDFATNITIE